VPYFASTFQRLLEPLDRREMNRIVDEHDGNHGVGTGLNAWTCQRHLKALLFAQIAGFNSLREIEHGLAAQPQALYHLDLRLPRRSTLSDALRERPAAVFRDICQSLLGRASRSVRKEGAALIQLVDSSPISLRDPCFDWAEADNRIRGLKLHIGYDSRADVPDWAEITSPKLTVVSVPIADMAQLAIETLLEEMETGKAPTGWRTLFQPKLVVRGSCAAVRTMAGAEPA